MRKVFAEEKELGRAVRTKAESGGRRVAPEVRHCDVDKVARDARRIEAASGSSPGVPGGSAAQRCSARVRGRNPLQCFRWEARSGSPNRVARAGSLFCLELEIVPVLPLCGSHARSVFCCSASMGFCTVLYFLLGRF